LGTPTAKETRAQAATSGNIQVALEILAACGLSDADAFFAFDSGPSRKEGHPTPECHRHVLHDRSHEGPSLKLVGRADPRGPTEYNMTLGQARSDSGQKYWTDEGVGQSSVQSTSRGAIDATGTDEAGWALDRRVDIMPGS
jgi:peptidoglycan-associated lipoprotein